MRRLSLALVVVLGLAAPAFAGGPFCGTGGQLNPIASSYQQMTVSTTAVALTSIPSQAYAAVIIVESNSIRARDDGTNPTASVGMPYGVSSLPQVFTICGRASLDKTRLIRAGGSDAAVNVSYYQK